MSHSEFLSEPRATAELFGHKDAESLLLQSVLSEKTPHALLLSGEQGIGKATLAYRLARFLLTYEADNILFKQDHRADNLYVAKEHAVFRKVAGGSHPDLLVLDEKAQENGTISVEEARKVGAFLRLTPAESLYRVVVIDSVDAMNQNAANAILKLLEEPPTRTVMILVSHMPGKLLPTIRSRCRHIKLHAPERNEAHSIVMQHVPDSSADSAEQLLTLANGAPGRAIQLYHAQALSLYTELLSLIDTNGRTSFAELAAFSDKLADKKQAESWEIFPYLIAFVLHRMMIATVGNDTSFAAMHDIEMRAIQSMSERYDVADIVAMEAQIQYDIAQVNRINTDKKTIALTTLNRLRQAA